MGDGLIVDATIADSEAGPYWRDAERALATLVRLSTWVKVGVRAWGYSTPEMTRRRKLSVSDNSGKLFSIITADEEAYTEFEEQPLPGEAQGERTPAGVAY